MEYKVTIYDGRNERYRFIDIERVPYKVTKIMQSVGKKIDEVRDLDELYHETESAVDTIKKEKVDGWREKLAAKKQELKELREKIYAVADSGFFDDRFEAIKIVLSVNGIGEADELMDKKTWEEKMDYADPMAFLDFCVSKDLKKVLAAAETLSMRAV